MSESASISSAILVDALKTLDTLDVFPRTEGIKPFLLLDGHQSRLEMPFLKYINSPEDHWIVCLGVPYGTALWQVGDSKEQNGSFNIAINKAKQELLEFRENKNISGCLQPTDLIPLINKAWDNSFAKVATNKKAIADRGWNPLNYNLLIIPEIRQTMTKEEQDQEMSSQEIFLPSKLISPTTYNDNTTVTEIETLFGSDTSTTLEAPPFPKLNFSTGMSSFCLQAILSQEQLHEAREKIKIEQENGKNTIQRLKDAKKVTAGICYKSGTNRLGKQVFQVCRETVNKKIEMMKQKIMKEEKDYLEAKQLADNLIATGKSIEKFTNADLKIILKSLKRKGDEAFPTRKNDMVQLYNKWNNREPMTLEYNDIYVLETASNIEEEECEDGFGDIQITNEAIV